MTDLTMPPGFAPVHNRYVLPSFVERTSYGVKESNPYNKMFEDRIIFLGVQIDDASANDIMAALTWNGPTLRARGAVHGLRAVGLELRRDLDLTAF